VKRTYLVRHGTPAGVTGRCIGHCDVPLSEAGREEMRRLATSLPAEARRIVSSDLTRAVDSARVLAEAMNIPVSTDSRLREMDFGDWDGKDWRDIHATDADALSHWCGDFVNAPPPGGESLASMAARVALWLDDPATVRADGETGDSSTDSSTIVVAHAGVIRASICIITGVPLQHIFEITVDYGTVAAVLVSDRPEDLQLKI
jgi:alpha-ribazole phosphatase